MSDQNNNISLLADIGGTFCRFSIIHGDRPDLKDYKKIKCDDFDCLEDAIDWYLQEIKQQDIENIFFAIAAPIQGEIIKIVNNHWLVDRNKLINKFNLKYFKVINDFKSIAYAVIDLQEDDIESTGEHSFALSEKTEYSLGIVGPGTGLGGSAVKKSKEGEFVSALELGHVGFSPQNQLQKELTEVLEKTHTRVINETLVSGPGIENTFEAILELNGQKVYSMQSEDIFSNINNCKFASQSVDLFFEILGQVAGDFALSIGAFDGILLTGDLINNHLDLLKSSQFSKGFINKNDYSGLMKSIPTGVVRLSDMGLNGLLELYNREIKL